MKKIYSDTFDSLENYWVEGGENAWVENNRLYQKADPVNKTEGRVSTIWCKTEFPENVEIRVNACVVSSDIGANNINLFLSYSDPTKRPLIETRDARADGDYPHYHGLNGYIFTFLRDWQLALKSEDEPMARSRMRRCPGFHLMKEKYFGQNVAGQTYALVIRKDHGTLSFTVNGETILCETDASPLAGGHFGFRTFRTFLWWSDLEVYEL